MCSPLVGFIAAAIGTTLTGWAMVGLLWRGSRDMGPSATLDLRFKARIWPMLAASAAMGLILWVTERILFPYLQAPGLRYLALAALVSVGIAAYFAIGHLIGAFRLSEFRRALRR